MNPHDKPKSNWPKDLFGRAEIEGQLIWIVGGLILLAALWFVLKKPSSTAPEVIVYAAQDQVFAEPILKQFERETGIRVRTVFDSEAAKTVGLANRLLAEQRHPQCDVFWGNEELRTRQLAALGVFRATNGWASFGYRSRRLAMRDGDASVPAPSSWSDLTNAAYRGKISMANPLFGTTATHLMALRHRWGESNWLAWCRALAANKPFIVDGNSVAVKFLVRGEAAVALTDSDDIAVEIREGAKLQALPMNGETLLIPNTVAVVNGCPHPDAAQKLFEFLQTRAVTDQLIAARALEGAWSNDAWTSTLHPDWDALVRDLNKATEQMQEIFRK